MPLQDIIKGVSVISETESFFEVITESLTFDNNKIIADSFDSFCAKYIDDPDFANNLKNKLHDIKVIYVGDVSIDVYIMGKNTSEQLIFLRAQIVET